MTGYVAPVQPSEKFTILNPKRESENQSGRASWYPYYAGFSQSFAHSLLASAKLGGGSAIIDPWNGSGTTTAAAAGIGHTAFGYDLNPVMVIAAKARMLNKRERGSLVPLAKAICSAAEGIKMPADDFAAAISTWFIPESASGIRSIELGIQKLLISGCDYVKVCSYDRIKTISDLAAFFYVALFRTMRSLMGGFSGSNPTWIKKPADQRSRLRPSIEQIKSIFLAQTESMVTALATDLTSKDSEVTIDIGSSDSIPLKNGTMDFVLSSPPYCTRIDYAVATSPELAILGYRGDVEFEELRRRLIGTSTVPKVAPEQNLAWGPTCLGFLDKLSIHPSKASKSYYLKSHLQYFASIYNSLSEISRILRKDGHCVLVVQDSHYKEIHNDLPTIIADMAASHSMGLNRRQDFKHHRTMAGVNPDVRKYRSNVTATESVLCFSKN
ncbi:hypothetical protein OH491_16625 [Termitidicoccus mucosus]|uniref:hypothetical protein n=1 Tax=Termitidicoccus mucosus TaxID=1184151 RepID=UPI003183E150